MWPGESATVEDKPVSLSMKADCRQDSAVHVDFVAPLQLQPVSTAHLALQPSSLATLPSSQPSVPATTPSPQVVAQAKPVPDQPALHAQVAVAPLPLQLALVSHVVAPTQLVPTHMSPVVQPFWSLQLPLAMAVCVHAPALLQASAVQAFPSSQLTVPAHAKLWITEGDSHA